jgi:type IV pilus assembly protein PilY1
MFNGDLRSDVTGPAGKQNVRSYFIGLGSDFVDSNTNQLNAAFGYLDTAATRGGGKAFQANDLNDLTTVLDKITNEITKDAASFAAPTVGVNAFNRTRNLDELYVSMFQPSATYHWPGNIKKYKLYNGALYGKDSAQPNANPVVLSATPAVNPATGLFRDSSMELWSATLDGSNVQEGGAAAKLPDPATRLLYTYLDANKQPSAPVNVTGAGYLIDAANASVSDALLGTGVTGGPSRTQLIDWLHGIDVQDEDGDNDVTDARKKVMGDPLHAQPAVVVYGGTALANNANDAVLYTVTNDGFLHAFDVVDGHELWAFIPEEMLGDQVGLYNDDNVTTRHYGLDGDVRVEKFDINSNGVVDGSDRVLIYFGMGRGGNQYYALDVTNKTQPKFAWSIGSSVLTGVGQTWSPPVMAHVHIANPASTQNSQRLVLIMGGGYDPSEDGTDITGPYRVADTVGNHIYMVDALSGNLLWSAGPSGASLNLTRMDHSFPAGMTVIDLDGDGYADRMYAGDMGGQVWRFDINNGQNTAGLVAGGVMASLGAHDDNPQLTANARRFYSPPDVALVASRGGQRFLNIAIGSGYRGHPLNTGIQDRFYGLRDYNVSHTMTQAEYNAWSIVQDANMTDITDTVTPTIASGSPGWKLRLDQNGGWVGEKVLGAATTLSGRVLFTTYAPATGAAMTDCVPNTGTNRAYAVDVSDGSPSVDVNADGAKTIADRSVAVNSGSIVGDLTVLFMGTGRDGDVTGSSCTAGEPNCSCDANTSVCTRTNPDTVCTAGVQAIPVCTQINRLRKTFWMDNGAN